MAILTFSAVVGDARKKIGGVVFTKGHSGAVLRRKTSPVQPRTQPQSGVRANFTKISKAWSALGAALVAAWNSYAAQYPQKNKLGQSHTLTGLQMYQRCNRNIDTISPGTTISTPPADQAVESPAGLTAVLSVGGGTLTITPGLINTAAAGWALFATAPLSAGKTFVGAKYRIIAYDTSAFNLFGPAGCYTTYVGKFGVPGIGKNIGIKLVYVMVATGLKGTPLSLLCAVGA